MIDMIPLSELHLLMVSERDSVRTTTMTMTLDAPSFATAQFGAHGSDWAKRQVWWQVYPLGFAGSQIRPAYPGAAGSGQGLRQLINWLDYVQELGCTGLLLGPIITSQTHGYDTLDFFEIDPRLGTMDDFADLIAACQQRGLAVVLDGVFSHVGDQHPWLRGDLASGDRDFDLFDIDWDHWGGPRPRVFEGHGGLARLNHRSASARNLVVDVMKFWLEKGIAGWRLDAAYSVPQPFWADVIGAVRADYPGAWIFAEMIHGDYANFAANTGVSAVTQYELWKSIWSSLKDKNFFELDWTLKRHNEMISKVTPQTFVGNHDVTRIATEVGYSGALAALAILMTVGGVPSVYYGDEQAFTGLKEQRLGGDDAIRPAFPWVPNGISDHNGHMFQVHQQLIGLRRENPWLTEAVTTPLHLECRHYVYRVNSADNQHGLIVEIDANDSPEMVKVFIKNLDGYQLWSNC
jgi:glycosidase